MPRDRKTQVRKALVNLSRNLAAARDELNELRELLSEPQQHEPPTRKKRRGPNGEADGPTFGSDRQAEAA